MFNKKFKITSNIIENFLSGLEEKVKNASNE